MSDKPKKKERIRELESEVARLRAAIDPEVTYKDLELQMRDGTIDLTAVLGDGAEPAMKWLAGVMLHVLLGEGVDDPVEPDNYRMTVLEWSYAPAGEFRPLRCSLEVIKPGGKSSHEIRRDLEAKVAECEARLAALGAKVNV